MSGPANAMIPASKRQRLSLLDADDLFRAPRTSSLFPPLNPVGSHDEATALSQPSLAAAYIDTIKVSWLQTNAGQI